MCSRAGAKKSSSKHHVSVYALREQEPEFRVEHNVSIELIGFRSSTFVEAVFGHCDCPILPVVHVFMLTAHAARKKRTMMTWLIRCRDKKKRRINRRRALAVKIVGPSGSRTRCGNLTVLICASHVRCPWKKQQTLSALLGKKQHGCAWTTVTTKKICTRKLALQFRVQHWCLLIEAHTDMQKDLAHIL